jgi:hypothetical protein
MLSQAPPDLYDRKIDALKAEISSYQRRIADLEDELRLERMKTAQFEKGLHQLRTVLNPLYTALGHVYGEIDSLGVNPSPANAPDGRIAAVWDNWKRKLGGHTAKAIDALLLHGAMNQTQLRIQLGCATGTVTNVVSALNKAGLINKADGKISLKNL